MTKRSKIIIISGLVIILLIVGGFFIYSFVQNNEPKEEPVEYSPEGEIPQRIDNPEVIDSGTASDATTSDTTAPNNSDLAATLSPSKEMQAVIDKNKDNLNNEEIISSVAPSYPTNLIPLYKANEISDSADITTNNGNPGWTCQYGSDAYVNDVADFYKSLLKSTTGYSDETNMDTQKIAGTIDNCFVTVTVTPNNPDRTGMNAQSDVDIFIERTS